MNFRTLGKQGPTAPAIPLDARRTSEFYEFETKKSQFALFTRRGLGNQFSPIPPICMALDNEELVGRACQRFGGTRWCWALPNWHVRGTD